MTETERWHEYINAHYYDIHTHLTTWSYNSHINDGLVDDDVFHDALLAIQQQIEKGKVIEYPASPKEFGLLFLVYRNALFRKLKIQAKEDEIINRNWGTDMIEVMYKDGGLPPDELIERDMREKRLNEQIDILRSRPVKDLIYRKHGAGAVPLYMRFLAGQRLNQQERTQINRIKATIAKSRWADQIRDMQ